MPYGRDITLMEIICINTFAHAVSLPPLEQFLIYIFCWFCLVSFDHPDSIMFPRCLSTKEGGNSWGLVGKVSRVKADGPSSFPPSSSVGRSKRKTNNKSTTFEGRTRVQHVVLMCVCACMCVRACVTIITNTF